MRRLVSGRLLLGVWVLLGGVQDGSTLDTVHTSFEALVQNPFFCT